MKRVGGDLIRGLILEGVVFERPGARLTVERAVARLSWAGLMRRRLTIDRLEVEAPRLRLDPRLAREGAPRGKRGGWTVAVARFSVEGGELRLELPKGERLVEGVSGRGSFQNGALALETLRARALGFDWSARGRVAKDSARLDLDASGPATARLHAEGGGARWALSGAGGFRGAAWTAQAALDGPRWSGRARLTGLDPAALAPGAKGRAAPLSAALVGAGSGTALATAAGRLRLTISERGGPQASGFVELSSGAASFRLALSSGAAGGLRGTASLARREVDARWTLSGGGLLRRFGGTARALSARGTVRGRWPDAFWTASASARGVSGARGTAERVAFSASGRGSAFAARVSARDVRGAGRLRIASAFARASGDARRQAVSFRVDAGTAAVAARGVATLSSGTWTARWEELSLSKPRTMRADRPFVTRVSRGAFAVEGLSLSGEKDTRLSLDARREGARWPRFSLRTRFDLQTLFAIGLMRAPASGRVDAALDLAGDLHAPSGRVTFDIKDATLAEIDAGSATIRARLDGRLARLDRFDWQLGRGRAVLTGSFPLKLSAAGGPDFALRVQARRLSLAPLARRAVGVQVTRPHLDADLTVRREAGRWLVEGGGKADAEAIALPSAGLSFTSSQVEFAAQGGRVVVTRSALSPEGKGARAALSGSLSPEGPALVLKGSALRLDTGRGLSATADAEVAVTGSWKAPEAAGTISVRRGDFTPLTARQKRRIDEQQQSALAQPRRPSPSTMDLRIVFDRNVWYKEKATSIELKGDLRLRKKPDEPPRLLGTVETVRGDYVYFSRVFQIQQGTLKLAGETPMDAVLSAQGLYVDPGTRTKIHLQLGGTLREPKLHLSSEPPMDERDIVSYLAVGRPLYEVGGVEGRKVGGTEEAAAVLADYLSQGLRRYLPPQLALDVFRVSVQNGAPGLTVGRYITRRLFVSYGQAAGGDLSRRVDATYTLSPHWLVETQNTSGRGAAGTGTTDNIVDLLFSFGFR